MRKRIEALLAKAGASGSPNVSTFHSFCVRLLRRDGDRLAPIRPNFTRQFTIYDDDDQISIIKGIYKALGLDEKFMQYRAALSRISHAKNVQQTPQDFYKDTTDPKMARLAVVFQRYEEALLRSNALDFDDLLLQTVRLLKHDADLRAIYGRKLQFLTIDEYQDTNRTQYELMRLLSESHRNIVVVGDEDQSIYGWRGADIRNILDFERDYPNASVIRLEQNYRSTQNILEAAGAVVANNKDRKGKNLWTDIGRRANRSRCTRRRMRKTKRCSSRIRSRRFSGTTRTIAWRCCTGPTSSRDRLKKRCGATAGSTSSSADSASTSARK